MKSRVLLVWYSLLVCIRNRRTLRYLLKVCCAFLQGHPHEVGMLQGSPVFNFLLCDDGVCIMQGS